ncbi:MAG: alpha/beta hydrolase, partial [Rhodoferax sp.]|nr:alpha/beta hydrolase [Rhodoferax sp.]
MVDALLLVPGLMCDVTVWEPVMPALQGRATCRVVALADVDELAQMARLLLADAPAHFALAG